VAAELRVVATAGHVDHGKSSLIAGLTGIDPDRWAEEKRRGLTIDLGYAWCTLPSGREVGFVDVPGHERFIGNMLAGVGPVPLVLFVVAADEGWKPQSEEHLQILDVLGVAGGVVALTKRDLVDEGRLAAARDEVRDRLRGTTLQDAPIVAVSSATGAGLAELAAALDAMLEAAPLPEPARARLFVDRVFTIKGSGTVVTGTLTGDCLGVREEVELYPTGRRARIRSLQTHKTSEERACPVSRVAANLAGLEREGLERGDVLAVPGAWRPTSVFDVELRPVRGLDHAITPRGAFAIHTGAAETSVRVRLLDTSRLAAGERAYARLHASRPLTLDVFDRFVLRDVGRRETVGGGRVLDVAPPRRQPVSERVGALTSRSQLGRRALPELLAAERGAVRGVDVPILVGIGAAGPQVLGAWLVADAPRRRVDAGVRQLLHAFHTEHPLDQGADLAGIRGAVVDMLRAMRAPADASLADALLDDLESRGTIVRSARAMRLASHHVTLEDRSEDVERLMVAIGGEHEATPPSVRELEAAGVGRDIIDAAARSGAVVRVGGELVFTAGFVARAETLVRAAGETGITVGAFREALATTRKYAVPLLEWFDRRGVTRREGDLRFPAQNV
jgi:selenocysteine-specific elongation factor